MENQSYAEAVHNAYNHCVAELERNKARFLKNPEKDFSRERKLIFSSCVRFCVQAGGGALQNELLRHFSFARTTPTKSAFCQQRGKISSEAFACLFRDFTDCLERIDAPKTLKGYQILASDGSAVNLPYNPSDTETFHENGERKGYNQIHLNALYQMLDGYYFDCVLAPEGKTHERAALLEMLSRFPNTLKAILLMDRGFEGYDVLASLLLSGQKFVLRLKDVNSTGILSSWFLPDDREFDTEIQTKRAKPKPTEKRIRFSRPIPIFISRTKNIPFSLCNFVFSVWKSPPENLNASPQTFPPTSFPFRKSRNSMICAGERKPLSAI